MYPLRQFIAWPLRQFIPGRRADGSCYTQSSVSFVLVRPPIFVGWWTLLGTCSGSLSLCATAELNLQAIIRQLLFHFWFVPENVPEPLHDGDDVCLLKLDLPPQLLTQGSRKHVAHIFCAEVLPVWELIYEPLSTLDNEVIKPRPKREDGNFLILLLLWTRRKRLF